VTYEWTMLPGRPRVGWHLADERPDCWETDQRARAITFTGAVNGPERIAEVEARGPGRVVRSATSRPRLRPSAVPVAG
jgi:hypothetical protein